MRRERERGEREGREKKKKHPLRASASALQRARAERRGGDFPRAPSAFAERQRPSIGAKAKPRVCGLPPPHAGVAAPHGTARGDEWRGEAPGGKPAGLFGGAALAGRGSSPSPPLPAPRMGCGNRLGTVPGAWEAGWQRGGAAPHAREGQSRGRPRCAPRESRAAPPPLRGLPPSSTQPSRLRGLDGGGQRTRNAPCLETKGNWILAMIEESEESSEWKKGRGEWGGGGARTAAVSDRSLAFLTRPRAASRLHPRGRPHPHLHMRTVSWRTASELARLAASRGARLAPPVVPTLPPHPAAPCVAARPPPARHLGTSAMASAAAASPPPGLSPYLYVRERESESERGRTGEHKGRATPPSQTSSFSFFLASPPPPS